MEKGYTLHFGGDSCTIYDNKDKTLKIAEVRMKEHRCFPIHLQYMGRTAMKAQEDQSWLWHRRLGHFNFQGLKILHQKKNDDRLTKSKLSRELAKPVYKENNTRSHSLQEPPGELKQSWNSFILTSAVQ
ncbi:UNVERIFIED_CONTAM: hypothetical protein Sangu_0857300 [Sesamum angustifolium]|uniref:GAG-pre-integrase domain-containing protein n=1 Tax=Sesamum angustifolium TaxID=2727405 RepID=A0AAW2P9K3_9LAMI